MKTLIILFLLFPISLLSQDFLIHDTKSQTNFMSIKDLDKLFDFSFTLSTIAMEDSFTNFSNTNKDPFNNFTSLNLTYEMSIYKDHSMTVSLFKEDSYGYGMSLNYIYRSIDELTKRKTGWGKLRFGFGVLLLNNLKLHDSPKALFSWFFKLGSLMSSYISIGADGFSLIPWEPGFFISDNNRFILESQLRWGVFGFYAGLKRFVIDDEGSTAILQHKNLLLKVGLAFFSEKKWRLLFYVSAHQKKLVSFTEISAGYSQTDNLIANLRFLGLEFISRYRSDDGDLRQYKWGFEVSFSQDYTDLLGSSYFSNKNTEFKLTWSSTFAL